jgi:hypothetical protein
LKIKSKGRQAVRLIAIALVVLALVYAVGGSFHKEKESAKDREYDRLQAEYRHVMLGARPPTTQEVYRLHKIVGRMNEIKGYTSSPLAFTPQSDPHK